MAVLSVPGNPGRYFPEFDGRCKGREMQDALRQTARPIVAS